MMTAFTVTLLVGVLAGILPARRAANLKPIDALRFE
jgi:ABC-type antimicrobial peptide transport system permease subunit